jgi:hypothetical protein
MAHFIALYTGQSLSSAKLVAVSSNPSVVRDFASRLLVESQSVDSDPVVARIESGRRAALRLIRESGDAPAE